MKNSFDIRILSVVVLILSVGVDVDYCKKSRQFAQDLLSSGAAGVLKFCYRVVLALLLYSFF